MNAIPLINIALPRNDNVNRVSNKLNNIPVSQNISGAVGMLVNSGLSNENQLRQEVNTSIVALKREAVSLENLIAQAAQTLQDVNNRLSELEGKQSDYVKKADATVDGVGGDGKYISAISETDGKISATATDLGNMVPVNSVTSGNLHSVTSNAVFLNLLYKDTLYITDTRNSNYSPSWYFTNKGRLTTQEFKSCSAIDSPFAGTFCTLITITPWDGISGGRPIQIAIDTYGGSAMKYRIPTADASAWGAWQKVTCLKEKQIRIDDASGYSLENGVYVKTISNFFTNNGISYSKVVNIRQVNNGNNLYPYFFIAYGDGDILKIFKFANINNTYVDVKVYYE